MAHTIVTDVCEGIADCVDACPVACIDQGKGKNKTFTIENLSSEVNLYEGDEIYSSGLGGKFPKGYLIGKVKSISKNQNLKFQEVEVSSSAEFDKGSKVLFISP